MSSCMSAMSGMGSVELSKGLKQLKGEHPPLIQQLEDLYHITQKIEMNPNLDAYIELKTKVEKFKAELDPHSEREEGVLFPMMGAYIGTTSGPIAVMEYEHDQAKLKIKEFLDADKEMLSNEELKISAGLIRDAYFILTEHFSKEENVLFPMAERMLTNEEKEELYQKIQEIK